ncbi:MAG TPA: protein disulfide oxidoreductase [Polyangiales bacterium]|nr:protein disulfide oxidoreductase [Polyangiales bacterium]
MQRLRAQRYWPWLRDACFAVLFFLAFRAYQQRDAVSGTAPQLSGTDLQGEQVALADYRGKPVLVYFWATWCGVCKATQPNVDALARELPVLSVASQSGSAAEVSAYAREHGVASKVVVDTRGALAKRFGVHAFPTLFVIDGAGAIRSVEVGYTTELGLRLRMWLAGS